MNWLFSLQRVRRASASRLCYLALVCRFWAGNRWWNTPPPEPKKVVRDERTTESDAIDGRLLGA